MMPLITVLIAVPPLYFKTPKVNLMKVEYVPAAQRCNYETAEAVETHFVHQERFCFDLLQRC